MNTKCYPHEREFTRIAVDLVAEVESQERYLRSETPRDLSMRGIFIFTDEQMPRGTNCRVTLRIGGSLDGLSFSVQGRVVRSETEGMAIEFTGISPESYQHLKNLVLYNSEKHAKRVERELATHLGIGERK